MTTLFTFSYRQLIFFFLFTWTFFLDFEYINFVYPYFSYAGFHLDFNGFKYFESKLLFLTVLWPLYRHTFDSLLYAVYVIVLFLIMSPLLTIFSFMDLGRGPLYSATFLLWILFLSKDIRFNLSFLTTLGLPVKRPALFMGTTLFICLIPFFLSHGFDVNFKVFLLQEIYETRAISMEKTSRLNSYLYSWISRVIAPVSFVYALYKRHHVLLILAAFSMLYLFVIGAHKSVFFALIVVCFFYFFGENIYKKLFYFFCLSGGFILISLYLSHAHDFIALESILTRRVFFIPALLSHYYFDFFSGNSLFLGHSIFSSFVSYPFDLAPSYLIGHHVIGKSEMGANNGLIADGFMNFGFWGVIIWSIAFSTLITFFKSLNISNRYFGVFFSFLVILSNSALLTSMLTHGGLLLILFSVFILFNTKET